MKHIAVIPARSGSKGVKNKNLKKLFGISLIGWAIIYAKESGLFSDIVVSTDSSEYAKEALKYGASVPSLRKKELALDSSNINEVLLELLQSISDYDTVTLIEPTCPIRNPMKVVDAMDRLLHDRLNCILSICRVSHKYHPRKQFSGNLDYSNLKRFTNDNKPVVNRQELSCTYIRSGAFYVFKIESFLIEKDIIHGRVSGFLDNDATINIDTEDDLIEMRQYEAQGSPLEWMKKYIL